jgi:uncharacterized membrane protein YagU involved in acid resistance
MVLGTLLSEKLKQTALFTNIYFSLVLGTWYCVLGKVAAKISLD